MTLLNPEEKRAIAQRFLALKKAIANDGPDVESLASQFQAAYRGEHQAYVDSFEKARDKWLWAGQLEVYLSEEIEPEFWHLH